MKKLTQILIILILLSSCRDRNNFPTGHFPEEVINFTEVNSSYDDYNSNAPVIYGQYSFNFSSNRKSKNDFDIVGAHIYIKWDEETGKLDIGDLNGDYKGLDILFDSVNTSGNELGPYSFIYLKENESNLRENYVMFYANDINGNYDIKYVYIDNFESTSDQYISSPQTIGSINTSSNELYPTFFGQTFDYEIVLGYRLEESNLRNIEKLIYCTDAEGNYNIYETDFHLTGDFIDYLSNFKADPLKLSISSSSDDKCPYVNGNVMVFTSNRPGGFGGFDLYYSIYSNGSWSDPINFGERINSEYDEYRPVVIRHNTEFSNDLLIFSSDRPGGMGGFDLYYTGIDKLTDQ